MERTADADRFEERHAALLLRIEVTAQERLQEAVGKGRGLLDEGDANDVRAGFTGTRISRRDRMSASESGGLTAAASSSLIASDGGLMNRPPVDSDDDLMLEIQSANFGRGVDSESRLKHIFSREREIDRHCETAARPQRKAFNVVVLTQVCANAIRGKNGSDVGIADRQAG